MEQRTIERFRARTLWLHWIHTACFGALLITGALMFFHLTGVRGGQQVRLAHRVAAALFVAAHAVFSLLDPRAAAGFLNDAFRWSPGDVAWLKLSVRHYFGGRQPMPPQDRINGDQKLWQLVVILSGSVSTVTGVILWFFTLKVPLQFYAGVLLTHAVAFVVVSLLFPAHFFLRTMHPEFEESLSSMLDGKISPGYAKRLYPRWLERVVEARPKPGTPTPPA
jgi:formate dehydrogenase gamma subunit